MKNRLKTYRKKANLTQEELSNLVGVSSDYISMIERGKRNPSFKLAGHISSILKRTIDEIFFT